MGKSFHAFPTELSRAGESKCLHEKKLSHPLGHPISQKGWPYTQGDPDYPQGDPDYPQGDPDYPKVTLTTPKVTLTTLDKCQMCHINCHIYARRQGEVKWMKSNRVSLWQRACARNALDFAILYRQCTNLFIFRFVSLHHILYTILYLYVIICNLFIYM